MRGRHAVRWVLLAALVWVAVAAVQVALAYRHMQAADSAADDLRTAVDAASIRSGALHEEVDAARDRLEAAHALLAGPVLAPFRILPYAGRQLRATAAMAGGAARAAEAGLDPLAEARRFLVDKPRDDAARLAAVRRVAASVRRANGTVAAIELGPADALLPPIADRRRELASDLDELRARLADATEVATGVAELLAGPRRYLLFAANNAEMRAGSGMFLSAGEIAFSGGSMEIGEVEPTADLVLTPEEAPPIEGDLATLWGWLEPNRDFRNLAVTPRFGASAELALQMWEARTGSRLDGVIVVDAAALAAVLRAGGPVTVDETELEASDAIDFVLHDQYEVLGTVGGERAARRDALGRLAAVAFQRVADGDVDMARLAEGLAEAARGRHVLAWARRPVEQAAWTAAGVAGQLAEDSFGVALLNRGGNKLDYFVRAQAEISSAPGGGVREVVVTVRLRNSVGRGEVPYVAGPHPGVDAVAGEYVGLLAVTLPGDARRSRFEGSLPLAVSGADGPTRVIATEVRIPPGGRREIVFRTEVPAVRTAVQLEPSARLPAIRWRMGEQRFTDRERRDLVFE